MSTFIMLTRILPNSAGSPQTLEQLECVLLLFAPLWVDRQQ